jgi:hypothetical protein
MRSLPCLACLSACPFLHFALTDVMFVNAYGCDLFGGNYYSYVHGIDRYPTRRHAPHRTAPHRTAPHAVAGRDSFGAHDGTATSAPGPGSPLPHLHRDWARPGGHICTRTGSSCLAGTDPMSASRRAGSVSPVWPVGIHRHSPPGPHQSCRPSALLVGVRGLS